MTRKKRRPKTPPIHPGLQGITQYLSRKAHCGKTMPYNEFLDRLSRIPKEQGFYHLAVWAACLYQGQFLTLSEAVVPLLGHEPSPDSVKALVQCWTRNKNTNKPILLHEKVIYFLQAHVLCYGTDDTETPNPNTAVELAHLALAANDYLPDWKDGDDPSLSQKDRNMLECARSLQYDRQYSKLHSLVRGFLMLRDPPPRDPLWSKPEEWSAFNQEALGMPLDDFLTKLAGPTFLLASLWGTDNRTPTVNPAITFSSTLNDLSVVSDFFDSLSLSIDDAITRLTNGMQSTGILPSPVLFFRSPFIRFANGTLVAASPTVVTEQLRAGIWARHLKAAKASRTADAWFAAFGDLFEKYCRNITCNSLRNNSDIIITTSDTIGAEDEFEDIVLESPSALVIIAAKASTVPEHALKGSRSPREALEWFNRFFFATAKSTTNRRYRDGAIRIMNRKISHLFDPKAPIFPNGRLVCPVIVVYDNMGTDSFGLYRWLEERIAIEGLDGFGKDNVCPITVINIDEYEETISALAQGASLQMVFADRAQHSAWRNAPMTTWLRQQVLPGKSLTLDYLDRELDDIQKRIAEALGLSEHVSSAHLPIASEE